MRLAFFSNPENINYISKIFQRYLNEISVLYVIEQSVKSDDLIECYCFNNKVDCDYSFLRIHQIDVVLVYGWNHLIPVKLLENISFYNIHPSLLPFYRGPDPITFQILNKERYCGVTIHLMDENFDTGPICIQKQFDVNYNHEIHFIMMQFLRTIKLILNDFIEALLHEKIKFTNQSNVDFSYFSYDDLNRYIITSDTRYADFIRICNAFKGKYHVMVMIDNKKRIISSYSNNNEGNSVKFMLYDQYVYLNFRE